MALDKKTFNYKVLHIVETDDFDIKNVLIRGRMQKLQTKQWAAEYLAGSSGSGSEPSGLRPDE